MDFGERATERDHERFVRALQYGEEQLLLCAEHAHHIGLAHSGRARHLVGGRPGVSALAKHSRRCLKDEDSTLVRCHARYRNRCCCSFTLDMVSVDN